MVTYVTDDEKISAPTGGTAFVDGVKQVTPTPGRSIILTSQRTRATETDYKRIIAQGGNATFNYKRTKLISHDQPLWYASVEYKNPISKRKYSENGVLFPSQWLSTYLSTFTNKTADDRAADDIALGFIRRKLNTQIETSRNLVPLAELYKTRDLIQDAASQTHEWLTATDYKMQKLIKRYFHVKRYRFGIHNVRKKKLRFNDDTWKGSQNWAKNPLAQDMFALASKRWLEYKFAIMPTLADIDRGFASLAHWQYDREFTTKKLFGVHQYSKLTSENVYSGSFNETFLPHAFSRSRVIKQFRRYTSYYGGAFNIDLHSSEVYDLNTHLGMSIENVWPTIWELIPYSWVIDYFTTAGAYLEDVFTYNPGTTRYLYNTIMIEYEKSVVNELILSPAADTKLLSGEKFNENTFKFIHVNRTALGNLPYRSLRFNTADEIAQNSVNRLLNLVAVLGVRAKSSRVGW